MKLNDELLSIQAGKQGEGIRKILATQIEYGEALGAEEMVKITGNAGHVVFGSAPITWGPVFDLMDRLINYGLVSKIKYTADPKPYDPKIPMTLTQKLMGSYIFSSQKRLDRQHAVLGLMSETGYTCTCYMPEVGNIPKKGDILSWAESSAVVYANSVIGARCNRNSGIIELMSNILGYVPNFGFLLDEGRKADWIIEIRTKEKPEAQILGSAIGLKVVDQVPYIKGLDRWLGNELDQDTKDYLKDMGAAAASNGAVGLYHVEGLTPEAAEQGEALIRENAPVYVIDDAELKRVRDSYPCIWKQPDKKPQLCFLGCPHFSINQILDWLSRIENGLSQSGRKKVSVPTVFTAAPDVADAFKREYPARYADLKKVGIILSSICPMSYTSNPMSSGVRVITFSNKFRTYSHAKFYTEDEIINIITRRLQ